MRIDEGSNSWNLLAIIKKARIVVGRGERRACGPGFELRLRRV